jgi:hypothetical protein
MELKESKKKGMDLKQSVYEKIADEFSEEIPIMSSLPKDERSDELHFRCMPRIKALAERIAFMPETKFVTPSHVHRAAHYLGVSILYHLFASNRNTKIAALWEAIMSSEETLNHLEQMDQVLATVRGLFDSLHVGIISSEEVDKKIDSMIEALPENTQHSTKVLVEQMRSRIDVPVLNDRQGQRRDAKGRFTQS